MGKKKKTSEIWEDTVADGFHTNCADQIAQYRAVVKLLQEQQREREYVTAEEFVEKLMPQMKDYLVKTYSSEKCHPHDLATAAASFMDAYWIISDYRGI